MIFQMVNFFSYFVIFILKVLKIQQIKLFERCEDNTGVIRILKSKNTQHNGQKTKRTKGQTTIYKTYTFLTQIFHSGQQIWSILKQ